MNHDAAVPAVLIRVANEMEAMIIIGHLEEHGIRAEAAGVYTAQFRAEAPGDVKVLVRAEDFQRAREILSELRQSSSAIDWSQVDVGDAEGSV